MEEYHVKADRTMDELLESLETLVDGTDEPYEVEYHVRLTFCSSFRW